MKIKDVLWARDILSDKNITPNDEETALDILEDLETKPIRAPYKRKIKSYGIPKKSYKRHI